MHGSERGFVTRLIVRSYEADGFGHVNNAIYVQYLEAARGDLVRAMGHGYAMFHEWGACPVVRRLQVEYVTPARVDDELEIEIGVVELRRTQFELCYELRNRQTGQVVATARTLHAFVNPASAVVRVPEPFARTLAHYRVGESTRST